MIAVPFVLSGVLVSLVLTRFPRDVGRLYAADLVGAALGCVLLVWVLEITDGPTAVLVICALAALGAVVLRARRGLAPAGPRERAASRRCCSSAAAGHTVLVWRGFPVLRILYVKAGFEARPLYERWNSYSRIRVNGNPERAREAVRLGPEPRLSRPIAGSSSCTSTSTSPPAPC